jgi:hypothetical protein
MPPVIAMPTDKEAAEQQMTLISDDSAHRWSGRRALVVWLVASLCIWGVVAASLTRL